MLMMKLIHALSLKCRGIDDEVLGYNSKEVELQFWIWISFWEWDMCW